MHACSHSIQQAEREREAQLELNDPLNAYLHKIKQPNKNIIPNEEKRNKERIL